ncbi:MAG: class I SAM-dependent methyltransferase [Acidobacteriota bacterium]
MGGALGPCKRPPWIASTAEDMLTFQVSPSHPGPLSSLVVLSSPSPDAPLPAEFLRRARALADAYLSSDDPHRQCGFGGGSSRWRAEREPLLDAIDEDGDFLDLGCANGLLLESVVEWGTHRGVTLTPHGLDLSAELIALARRRLPAHADSLHVGDAWSWSPVRRVRWVYALSDLVPSTHLGELVNRLALEVVAPGGRLILGSYGSRSRGVAPDDLAAQLRELGHDVRGESAGGTGPVTRFAWIDVST